jgi:hypothetical protein
MPQGRLASQYDLRLEMATSFHRLCELADDADGIDLSAVLGTMADAAEFVSVSARRDEWEAFGAVFGIKGEDLEAGNRKLLAILRAKMSGTRPAELDSDAWSHDKTLCGC